MIFDSLQSNHLPGHVKIQVAMIAQSPDVITIIRPPCKQQSNSVDCGLFAIANATEFCHTSMAKNIDFEPKMLRSHWLECLKKGTLSPFPRLGKRARASKDQPDSEVMAVFCKCRLPKIYGDMVLCDDCSTWYHKCCVGLEENFNSKSQWTCSDCTA